jgi:hypothetical protein
VGDIARAVALRQRPLQDRDIFGSARSFFAISDLSSILSPLDW